MTDTCDRSDDQDGRLGRRRVLGALGSLAALGLTGCSSITDESTRASTATTGTAGTTATETTAVETTKSKSLASISVPDRALSDERLSVVAGDFEPGASVTITAEMPDAQEETWRSSATFTADEDGVVDLAAQAPDEGSYDGADPMGLVWSMEPMVGDEFFYAPPNWKTELTYTAESDRAVAEDVVAYEYGDPAVERETVTDGSFVGDVFVPAGDGPYPGVVVMHGSGGHPDYQRAGMLASHGYVALAIQYFGEDYDVLPDQLVEVPVEFGVRAVQWLADRDDVRGDVGLYGVSKGSEYAPLTAAQTDRVGAVVVASPSAYAFAGITDRWIDESSWTVDGDPVPFVSYPSDPSIEYTEEGAMTLRSLYEAAVEQASEETLERAALPMAETDADVLALSGVEDAMWQSTPMAETVVSRLDRANYGHHYDHRSYEDAGHWLALPYEPTSVLPLDEGYAMGGTPAGAARGGARAWRATLDWYERSLG